MTETPAILLIFDLSALISGNTKEWQEFSQVGECQVPEAVWEEVRFLCNRAPEPELEKVSREFVRFYPRSGWILTKVSASHPTLQGAGEEELSKQARLTLAVAECVHGISRENPKKLVVLVTNSQPLTQQVQALTLPNICGITVATLKQWSRSKQQPMAVSQQIKDMRALARNQGMPGIARSHPSPTGAKTQPTSSGKSASKSSIKSSSKPQSRPQSVQRSSSPNPLAKVLANLSGVLVLAAIGFVIWRFGPLVWQKAGLPPLGNPQSSPASPK